MAICYHEHSLNVATLLPNKHNILTPGPVVNLSFISAKRNARALEISRNKMKKRMKTATDTVTVTSDSKKMLTKSTTSKNIYIYISFFIWGVEVEII